MFLFLVDQLVQSCDGNSCPRALCFFQLTTSSKRQWILLKPPLPVLSHRIEQGTKIFFKYKKAYTSNLIRNVHAAAAAAKSLQSCPTLCDPIDSSPPGSTIYSPGKNTGMGCRFLLQCMKVKSESKVTQLCLTRSATPWTAAHQAPPSMGFSRQEYWSRVPLPSPKKCSQKWPK